MKLKINLALRRAVLAAFALVGLSVTCSSGHALIINSSGAFRDEENRYASVYAYGESVYTYDEASSPSGGQISGDETRYAYLVAGAPSGSFRGNTELHLQGGHLGGFVFGGNESGDFDGSSLINIDGLRDANDVFGGSHSGTFDGDSTINYKRLSKEDSYEITLTLYGGNETGGFEGTSELNIQYSGARIYGGSKSGSFVGNAEINVDIAPQYDQHSFVYGGNQSNTFTGNTSITIESGRFTSVFGGNAGDDDDARTEDYFDGNVEMHLRGGYIDRVYGGSYNGGFYGDISITIDGSNLYDSDLIGGSATRDGFTYEQGNISIRLLSGTLDCNIYAAGYINESSHRDTIATEGVYVELTDAVEFDGSQYLSAEYRGRPDLALGIPRKIALTTENSQYTNVNELKLRDFGELYIANGSSALFDSVSNDSNALNKSIVKTGSGTWQSRSIAMDQITVQEGVLEFVKGSSDIYDTEINSDLLIGSGGELRISSGVEGDGYWIRFESDHTLTFSDSATLSVAVGSEGLSLRRISNVHSNIMMESADARLHLNMQGELVEKFSQKIFDIALDTDTVNEQGAQLKNSNISLSVLANDHYGVEATSLIKSFNGKTDLDGYWFVWRDDALRFTNDLQYAVRYLVWAGGDGTWSQVDGWRNEWHSYDTDDGYAHTFDNDYQGGNDVFFYRESSGVITVTDPHITVLNMTLENSAKMVFEGEKIQITGTLTVGNEDLFFNGGVDLSQGEILLGSTDYLYIKGDTVVDVVQGRGDLEVDGTLTLQQSHQDGMDVTAQHVTLQASENVISLLRATGDVYSEGKLSIGNGGSVYNPTATSSNLSEAGRLLGGGSLHLQGWLRIKDVATTELSQLSHDSSLSSSRLGLYVDGSLSLTGASEQSFGGLLHVQNALTTSSLLKSASGDLTMGDQGTLSLGARLELTKGTLTASNIAITYALSKSDTYAPVIVSSLEATHLNFNLSSDLLRSLSLADGEHYTLALVGDAGDLAQLTLNGAAELDSNGQRYTLSHDAQGNILLTASGTLIANNVWVSTTGVWDESISNWQSAMLPGAGSTVYFSGQGDLDVRLDGAKSVAVLEIEGAHYHFSGDSLTAGSITVGSEAGLTLDNDVTVTGAINALDVAVTNNGELSVGADSEISVLRGAGTLSVADVTSFSAEALTQSGLVLGADARADIRGDVTLDSLTSEGSLHATGEVTLTTATMSGGTIEAGSLSLSVGEYHVDQLTVQSVSGDHSAGTTLYLSEDSVVSSGVHDEALRIEASARLTLGDAWSHRVNSLSVAGTLTLGEFLEVDGTLSLGSLELGFVPVPRELGELTPAITAQSLTLLNESGLDIKISDGGLQGLALGNGQTSLLMAFDEAFEQSGQLTLNGVQSYEMGAQIFSLQVNEQGHIEILASLAGNRWQGADGIWDARTSQWSEGVLPSDDALLLGAGSSSITLVGDKGLDTLYVDAGSVTYSLSGDDLKLAQMSLISGGLALGNEVVVEGQIAIGDEVTLSITESGSLRVDTFSNYDFVLENKGSLAILGTETHQSVGDIVGGGHLILGDGVRLYPRSVEQDALSLGKDAVLYASTPDSDAVLTLETLDSYGLLDMRGHVVLKQQTERGGDVNVTTLSVQSGSSFGDISTTHLTIEGAMSTASSMLTASSIGYAMWGEIGSVIGLTISGIDPGLATGSYTILATDDALSWDDFVLSSETSEALARVVEYGNTYEMLEQDGDLQIVVQSGPPLLWKTSTSFAGMYQGDDVVSGSELSLFTNQAQGLISTYAAFGRVKSILVDSDVLIDLQSSVTPSGERLRLSNLHGDTSALVDITGKGAAETGVVLYHDQVSSMAGAIHATDLLLSVEQSAGGSLSVRSIDLMASELHVQTASQLAVEELVADTDSVVVNNASLQLGDASSISLLIGSGETLIREDAEVEITEYRGSSLMLADGAELTITSDVELSALDNKGTLDVSSHRLTLSSALERVGDVKARELVVSGDHTVGHIEIGELLRVNSAASLYVERLSATSGEIENAGLLVLDSAQTSLNLSGSGTTTLSENAILSLGSVSDHALVLKQGAGLTLTKSSILSSLSNAGVVTAQQRLTLYATIASAGDIHAASVVVTGRSAFGELKTDTLVLSAALSAEHALASVESLMALDAQSITLDLTAMSSSMANGSYSILAGQNLSWDSFSFSSSMESSLAALSESGRMYELVDDASGLSLLISTAPARTWKTSTLFSAMYNTAGDAVESTTQSLFDVAGRPDAAAFASVEAVYVDRDATINLQDSSGGFIELRHLTGETGATLSLRGDDRDNDVFILNNTYATTAHNALEVYGASVYISNDDMAVLSVAEMGLEAALLSVEVGAFLDVGQLVTRDDESHVINKGTLRLGAGSDVSSISVVDEGPSMLVIASGADVTVDHYSGEALTLEAGSSISFGSDVTLTQLHSTGQLRIVNHTLTLEGGRGRAAEASEDAGSIIAKSLVVSGYQYAGDVTIGDELNVLAGGLLSVSTLNSADATAVVSGDVVITGSGGSYLGSFAGATLTAQDGAVQEVMASEGLTLQGDDGSFILKPASNTISRIDTTGVHLDLQALGAHQLTLTESSSMDGGTIRVALDVHQLTSSLTAQTVFAGTMTLGETQTTSILISALGDDAQALRDLSASSATGLTLLHLGDDVVVGEELSIDFAGSLARYIDSWSWSSDGQSIVVDLRTTFYEDVPTAGNGTAGIALAKGVDEHATPQSGGDLESVIGSLDDLITGASNRAVNELAAAFAGASVTSLGSAQISTIDSRLQAMRQQGMHALKAGEHQAWISAESSFSDLSAEGTMAGHRLDSWGGSVGAAWALSDQAQVALSFSALYGDLEADSVDHANGYLDSYYLSAMAALEQGAFTHRFMASLGWSDANLERTVRHAGGSYATQGDTDGFALGLMYELSYAVALDESKTCIIEPLINLSFVSSSMDGYTERGGDARLTVGEQENTYFTAGVGARYRQQVSRVLSFSTQALVLFDAGDRQSEAHVSLADYAGTTTQVKGSDPGSVGVELGVGASYLLSEQGSIYANGSINMRGEYTNVNATVGYRLSF